MTAAGTRRDLPPGRGEGWPLGGHAGQPRLEARLPITGTQRFNAPSRRNGMSHVRIHQEPIILETDQERKGRFPPWAEPLRSLGDKRVSAHHGGDTAAPPAQPPASSPPARAREGPAPDPEAPLGLPARPAAAAPGP